MSALLARHAPGGNNLRALGQASPRRSPPRPGSMVVPHPRGCYPTDFRAIEREAEPLPRRRSVAEPARSTQQELCSPAHQVTTQFRAGAARAGEPRRLRTAKPGRNTPSTNQATEAGRGGCPSSWPQFAEQVPLVERGGPYCWRGRASSGDPPRWRCGAVTGGGGTSVAGHRGGSGGRGVLWGLWCVLEAGATWAPGDGDQLSRGWARRGRARGGQTRGGRRQRGGTRAGWRRCVVEGGHSKRGVLAKGGVVEGARVEGRACRRGPQPAGGCRPRGSSAPRGAIP